MSVRTVFLGRHDFLIMNTVDHESNNTRKSLRLFAKPIVLAVKMVTRVSPGVAFLSILGPR
jgi:hypothetical protein